MKHFFRHLIKDIFYCNDREVLLKALAIDVGFVKVALLSVMM